MVLLVFFKVMLSFVTTQCDLGDCCWLATFSVSGQVPLRKAGGSFVSGRTRRTRTFRLTLPCGGECEEGVCLCPQRPPSTRDSPHPARTCLSSTRALTLRPALPPQVCQVLRGPGRPRAAHAHQGLRNPLRRHRVWEGRLATAAPLAVGGPRKDGSVCLPRICSPLPLSEPFLFSRHMQAGKFDIIPTMINVGSGLALLGVVSGWASLCASTARPGPSFWASDSFLD